jgi:DNA-binding NtrC family response regulator
MMPHRMPYGAATRTTVIVADDDDDLRAIVVETLRSDGHTVIEARDGAELLSVLNDALDNRFVRPDLILTDVLMPKLSGLVMTGFAPSSVAAVAKRLGAVGVLKKPFGADDLRIAVLKAKFGPGEAS